MCKLGIKVKLFSVLALMIVLFSCKDSVPSQYPGKKQMASILADIHMAEATLTHQTPGRMVSEEQSNGIYKSVLDKYGLTKAQFDSALNWYALHPKVYLKVYDEVIAKLSDIEAQVVSDVSKQEEKDKVLAEKMAFKSLWKGSTAYHAPYPDSIDAQLPFDIKIDSLTLGSLRYNALYKFKKEDLARKSEVWIISCYSDSTMDTLKTEIVKSIQAQATVITSELKKGKKLIGVKGFLLKHDPKVSLNVDIDAIQLEHMPSQNKADYE